jgi:ankyrin repeat protein
MVSQGRLDELKKVYESMPKDVFMSLKQQGGQTLLIFATHFSHIDVIDWLLSVGADVNEVSNVRTHTFDSYHFIQQRESALLRACHFNRLEAAKILIRHGANLNQVS